MIENGVDHGYNDQGKEQRADQTADDYPGQSVLPFCTRARCYSDRQHTEHHRNGGHKDRAKPCMVGLYQCVERIFSRLFTVIGKVNDHNGILTHQTDQHNNTQDGENVQ